MRADDGQHLAVWSRIPAQSRGVAVLVHGRTCHVAQVEDAHAAWVDAVVSFLRRPR
ncbi:hypothetical protein LL965_07385 [Xanthomonas cassavae CFBP 4642]|uniref:Alpha/beta hydrolase n=1 Tax=Xanthomonas cassavae CFBP 4642 TaxID=1219375 RepID=A0ABS8HCP2_9XANT|nr:hypothetical protein [Xanthomonas cassavae]MCC4619923.1 hypothetical protein [Xanthomonas cassavae CFBP 4642]